MAGGFTRASAACRIPEPPISDPFVVSYIQGKSRRSSCRSRHLRHDDKRPQKVEELAPMAALAKAGVKMISDDGAAVRSAEVMRRVFEYAKMFDLLLVAAALRRAFDDCWRSNERRPYLYQTRPSPGWPSVAEEIIIAFAICLLAEFVEWRALSCCACKHERRSATCSGEKQKPEDLQVSCEVTPHHFTLTDEAVEHHGTMAKMCPPLRTQEDVDAIIEGLALMERSRLYCYRSCSTRHPRKRDRYGKRGDGESLD